VRIELPDGAPGLDPYQAAAQRITDWQTAGVLRQDPGANFYGYRMSYTDPAGRPRQTIGVIGALALEPPGRGIFPHERTTPKAKSDRLQLLETAKVNTSPIWVLSMAKGLADAAAAPETVAGVADADGVMHEAWPIGDPDTIAQIMEIVGSAPVVLADGHHRFETALTYQAQQQDQHKDQRKDQQQDQRQGTGASDFVMALVVELVEDQLSVQGIHRLLRGLPEDFDLVAALGAFFDLTPVGQGPPDATILRRMADGESLALVTKGGTWLLDAKPETISAAGQDLDSSRLEVALAALPEHDLVYQHGLDLAVGAVTLGEAEAAVLLRPVTVEQIAATGQGGERMPPKTTFFWPKPRTGFVFRKVAD
jgi:uncharacterized protein (DUF1015 family)